MKDFPEIENMFDHENASSKKLNEVRNQVDDLVSEFAQAIAEMTLKHNAEVEALEAENTNLKAQNLVLERLYNVALRDGYEATLLDGNDETSAPDYAGVEAETTTVNITNADTGEILNSFKVPPITWQSVHEINLAAEDDTVDMEADSGRYVIEEREDSLYTIKDTENGKYLCVGISGIVYGHNDIWAADGYEYDDAQEHCNHLNAMEADSEGAS